MEASVAWLSAAAWLNSQHLEDESEAAQHAVGLSRQLDGQGVDGRADQQTVDQVGFAISSGRAAFPFGVSRVVVSLQLHQDFAGVHDGGRRRQRQGRRRRADGNGLGGGRGRGLGGTGVGGEGEEGGSGGDVGVSGRNRRRGSGGLRSFCCWQPFLISFRLGELSRLGAQIRQVRGRSATQTAPGARLQARLRSELSEKQ